MDVEIPVDVVSLPGQLEVPEGAQGIVAFAHGTGSGRFSPRNQQVAAALRLRRLGTLLMDLLTEEEEEVDLATAHLRFNIALLAERLTAAVDWLRQQPRPWSPFLGLFGASTGAAAALMTASRRPESVRAVVSRGGRPDLADDDLPAVRAPTLLIVGGRDESVLGLNRMAMERLTSEVHLAVVPGATHLFEEPGALDEVSRLAGDWFERHLK